MKLGDIWLLLLLLNLNLPVREAGDSSYVLRHHGGSSEDATAAVGAWGEPLMIREVVHIPHSGTAGGEFAVQLYLGDLLSEARRGEAVELHCEAMSLRPYKEQCDVLHERIRQLAAMAEPLAPDAFDWRAPALCDDDDDGNKGDWDNITVGVAAEETGGRQRRRRRGRRRGFSFLVLGDSHTRIWRLAALRSSVPFTVVEAMGATAHGVASNRSKSGSRQLFAAVLQREKAAVGLAVAGDREGGLQEGDPWRRHSHLVVQLGEVDIGSSAWWRAATQLREEPRRQHHHHPPPPPDVEDLAGLDVRPQLTEATDRFFGWLVAAATDAGFPPGRVVVFGPTLPTVGEPWDNDTGNSDANERRHVRSSKAARSDATRYLCGLLRAGAEQWGEL